MKHFKSIFIVSLLVLFVITAAWAYTRDYSVSASTRLWVGQTLASAGSIFYPDSARIQTQVLFNGAATFASTAAYSAAVSFTGDTTTINGIVVIDTVSGTIVFTGPSVTINGYGTVDTLTGNVTFTGTTTTINGIAAIDTISGTVVFTGPSVAINGYGTVDTLAGDVRFTGATITVNGVLAGDTLSGAWAATDKFTFDDTGLNLALRTITAGDSVFLHTIVDAADTTLKTWNGSAWVTIQDLVP